MVKPNSRHRPPSGRTNLASCIVATIFLIFLVIVTLIVYFTVFRPRDPKISVSAVQLPSFAVTNNTANFTFSQYAAVRNPNRATFSHFDSRIQLLYSGNQVGFMFIPAGKIDAGRTQYMAATFSVQSFPLSPPASAFPPVATAVSAAAALPGLSGIPASPGVPGPPGHPGLPGTPETPGVPRAPGNRGIPGTPETPETPGIPGVPGSRGMPGTPGLPGTPGYPGFPETPGLPETPGIPGTPAAPGIPGSPVVPGMPGTPGFGGTGPNVGDGYMEPGFGYGNRVGPTMEIESRMELAGRVRVLHFFTHHVVAKSGCRVTVSVRDGSVLGFHC